MLDKYTGNPVWHILVETAQRLPMYASHLSYTRDTVLPMEPSISPEKLSQRLDIPLGEALVILYELRSD